MRLPARLRRAHRRIVAQAQELMAEKGLEPQRLKMAAVCSVCAEPFVNYMREFAAALNRARARPVPVGLTGTLIQEGETEVETSKKTIIVFSGDFDKVMAAFIIANGAAAMGDEVTMFFTFWGLNALRKPDGSTDPRQERAAEDVRRDDAARARASSACRR